MPFANDAALPGQGNKQQSATQSSLQTTQPQPKPVKFSPDGSRASQSNDDF